MSAKPLRNAVILLTDMTAFAKKTAGMAPESIRDFLIDYQSRLKGLVLRDDPWCDYAPSAGDGAVAVFHSREIDKEDVKCIKALDAGINIARAVANEDLPETRVGIFKGGVIEAALGDTVMQFGGSFAAASRLEELCAYFGLTVLMDREVAKVGQARGRHIASIGKITPKHFTHPIHVYTEYAKGLHGIPEQAKDEDIKTFIRMKNRAIELFFRQCHSGDRAGLSKSRGRPPQRPGIF